MGWPFINLKLELGPLSIKEWDTGEKHGKIGQNLAELVFWLSCKISFFTIYNRTNGAADNRESKQYTVEPCILQQIDYLRGLAMSKAMI